VKTVSGATSEALKMKNGHRENEEAAALINVNIAELSRSQLCVAKISPANGEI
jgi:hypothetical protein